MLGCSDAVPPVLHDAGVHPDAAVSDLLADTFHADAVEFTDLAIVDAQPQCTYAWRKMSTAGNEGLRSVWMLDNNSAFAVGASGAILHFDGQQWEPQESGTNAWLYGVWGSSASDVFAVGGNAGGPGIIRHFDGTSWTSMTSNASESLRSVSGTSSTNVIAVGASGTVIRYDGTKWKALKSETKEELSSVWSFGPNDSAAVSSGFAKYLVCTLGNCTEPFESTFDLGNRSGVWGSSSSNVYATGFGSQPKLAHFDGSSWQPITSVTDPLYAVWGSGNGQIFAVGDYGTIWGSTADGWKKMNSGTSNWLFSVHGMAMGHVMAVGYKGTILRYRCE